MALKESKKAEQANTYELVVNVDGETFEKAINAVYKRQVKNISIQGFRKGKAPRRVVEKMYGSEVFYEDAMQDCYPEALYEAAKEADVKIVKVETLEAVAAGKDGFTFKATVVVEPDMEIKDYLGIEVTKKSTEVTDELVDEEIEKVRDRNSRMVTVEDRPAQDGDMVLIDYEGWVGDNQFEGGTAERYPLKLGSGTFIPGFEEQLVGVSTGENKDVVVTFPEDYHEDSLAGAEAVFKCKVHEIKYEDVPEIDDEFVKDVSEFDTLDELKADERRKLEEENKKNAENAMRNSAIEKVYEANDIEVPDAMVETEIDSMMNEFDQQLRSQGMDLEGYFKYLGQDADEFRGQLKEDALKRVKTRMIVSAIAAQEGFEASDEEIDNEVETMAKAYGMEADVVKGMLGEENLKMIAGDIKNRKAIDCIFDNAVIK